MQWTIVIAASSRFLISGSTAMCDKAFNYQVYAIVLLACFGAACIVEIVAIREGLKGARLGASVAFAISQLPPDIAQERVQGGETAAASRAHSASSHAL